jgi:hypothetical protein
MVMRRIFAIISYLVVAGCTQVPPLQEDGVAISAIVQRIKCEIAWALPKPQGKWPTGPYQWMRTWTAKVDLTLATNDQASVNPSAVFTRLLPTVAVPGVGNVGRMFTFGVGAGLSTTAVRTEILTFSLSLAELRGWKRKGECGIAERMDLYGNLGLREWLASALAPVANRQLTVGRHPAPGGKSVPPPPVIEPKIALLDPLAKLKDLTDKLRWYAKAAEDALDDARRNATQNNTQATYDDAKLIYDAVEKGDKIFRDASAEDENLLKTRPEMKAGIDALFAVTANAKDRLVAFKKAVDSMLEGLPHDPPIDALSHSIQFVVALTGNATPSWTLVDVKGPGAAGNLLSGSHTVTHTLAIAMGSPSALPNDQSRQLNNLVIIQNLPRAAP